MASRHYIIYVPGLGDGYDEMRKACLQLWRVFGVRTELVPMQWRDGQPYREKFDRVVAAIQRAEEARFTVSLIGESAGGSMAINVAAHHPGLHRLVTLCGVDNPAMPVVKPAPAFRESLRQLSSSLPRLDKRRVCTVVARVDPVVAERYSIIPGAKYHRVLSIGHMVTISLCLTIYSSYLIHLIKQR